MNDFRLSVVINLYWIYKRAVGKVNSVEKKIWMDEKIFNTKKLKTVLKTATVSRKCLLVRRGLYGIIIFLKFFKLLYNNFYRIGINTTK